MFARIVGITIVAVAMLLTNAQTSHAQVYYTYGPATADYGYWPYSYSYGTYGPYSAYYPYTTSYPNYTYYPAWTRYPGYTSFYYPRVTTPVVTAPTVAVTTPVVTPTVALTTPVVTPTVPVTPPTVAVTTPVVTTPAVAVTAPVVTAPPVAVTTPTTTTTYRSFYLADAVATAATQEAQLAVRVPRDAEVWLQGVRMAQTGTDRQFVSPPLLTGREYIYEVRARWLENGRDVDLTRRVKIYAGDRLTVDFQAPPAQAVQEERPVPARIATGPPSTTYRSFYPSDAAKTQQAQLSVRVPRDADLWLQGTRMTLAGSERQFVSPPLVPGRQYTYEVRARWLENGNEVDLTRRVKIFAGERVVVDFQSPPAQGVQEERPMAPVAPMPTPSNP